MEGSKLAAAILGALFVGLGVGLVVRIGGYSDYFVRLTPEMQEEIILRTAHGL